MVLTIVGSEHFSQRRTDHGIRQVEYIPAPCQIIKSWVPSGLCRQSICNQAKERRVDVEISGGGGGVVGMEVGVIMEVSHFGLIGSEEESE